AARRLTYPPMPTCVTASTVFAPPDSAAATLAPCGYSESPFSSTITRCLMSSGGRWALRDSRTKKLSIKWCSRKI
ncbi:hypothetical protein H4R34_006209, partial [Dimargaris verticillata]